MMEPTYEVEKILKQRKIKGKTEYWIKWKGFEEKDNSWEPEHHLLCPSLLAAFKKQNEVNAGNAAQVPTSSVKSVGRSTRSKPDDVKSQSVVTVETRDRRHAASCQTDVRTSMKRSASTEVDLNTGAKRRSTSDSSECELKTDVKESGVPSVTECQVRVKRISHGVKRTTATSTTSTTKPEDEDDKRSVPGSLPQTISSVKDAVNVDGQSENLQISGSVESKKEPKENVKESSESLPTTSNTIITGFDRGLVAQKVVGVGYVGKELMFRVKWETNKKENVPMKLANQHIPRLVNEFLMQYLKVVDKIPVDDEND